MKKLVLFFLVLFTTCCIYAEVPLNVKKGNFMVGGGFTADYMTGDFEIFTIHLSPNIGYFVNDDLAIGLTSNIFYSNIRSTFSESWQFGLGLFGKYYFNNGLFAETKVGLNTLYKNEPNFNIFPRIGYAYFINKNVSIEGLIGPNFVFGRQNYVEIPLMIGFQIFL